MKPTTRLHGIMLVMVGLGLLVAFTLLPRWIFLLIFSLFIVAAVLDFLLIYRFRDFNIKRKLPEKWALDCASDIHIEIDNRGKRQRQFRVLPNTTHEILVEGIALPWRSKINAGQKQRIKYQLKMIERGEIRLGPVLLSVASPLGLWDRLVKGADEASLRVYPNFEPVVRHAILSVSTRQSYEAQNLLAKVGVSREFHQLREYQQGDMLEQVDWKATSRYRKLISREYREQRNQNVLIAIDMGRRMRALDGRLSQLDHCLNAALLVSYFALRQGDFVSIMGYGRKSDPNDLNHGVSYLPPVKGQGKMHVILNHLFNYHPSLAVGDYQPLAQQILSKQKRRALVLILSNFRTEDEIELMPAVRLLQTKHQVVVASLREQVVDDMLASPVTDLGSALDHTAARVYAQDRKTMSASLIAAGAHFLDETARQFPLSLAQHYMMVKQRGLL